MTYPFCMSPYTPHIHICLEFAQKFIVEGIIKKYSNFVGFPIYLNNEKVNTVGGKLFVVTVAVTVVVVVVLVVVAA